MEYELILLAAGFGRRFGANKLLYPVEGKPMVWHAAELLARLREREKKDIGEITAVTQYAELADIFSRRGIRTVFNPRSRQGISSSLRAGLQAVLEAKKERDPGDMAFCFFMGDQPYLQADTVARLLDQYPSSGKGMARLCCQGRPAIRLSLPGATSRSFWPWQGIRGAVGSWAPTRKMCGDGSAGWPGSFWIWTVRPGHLQSAGDA